MSLNKGFLILNVCVTENLTLCNGIWFWLFKPF